MECLRHVRLWRERIRLEIWALRKCPDDGESLRELWANYRGAMRAAKRHGYVS